MKQAVNQILAKNVADMNPQIVKGVEITDNIELMVEVDKNDEVNGGED